jgi:dTDP-4-dehydrorhamnose 3,5-epimerase
LISGLVVRQLELHPDGRGSFIETFRKDWLPAGSPEMVQSNLSRSRAGVLRGMHFHRKQSDWWVLIDGSAFVALVDLRDPRDPGSATTLSLDASEGLTGLYIPPGVAHGFFAVTDMALQYMVDAPFDGTDEFGFAWDDPAAAIAWPDPNPVLSVRDRSNPPLEQAIRTTRNVG